MHGIAIVDFEGGPAVRELPDAVVSAPGDVLVRVAASSLNPIDRLVVAGGVRDMLEYQFPVTLGRDVAGVVEAVGEGVEQFAVGDEVFGFVGLTTVGEVHKGAWAEWVSMPAGSLTHKPAAVSMAAAGALGLAGTAAIASVDSVGLAPGEVVLIIGATGGVGHLAVQLAAARGAEVIATGGAGADVLSGLGASAVLDRADDVVAQIRRRHPEGVHAVIELAAPSVSAPVWDAVISGGRVATTLGSLDVQALKARNITGENVMAFPREQVLRGLGDLVGSGRLEIRLAQLCSLHDTVAWLSGTPAAGVGGKVGVAVDA